MTADEAEVKRGVRAESRVGTYMVDKRVCMVCVVFAAQRTCA